MADKNKFGQYNTPYPLVDFMISLIGHNKDSSILEPSCGTGNFLDRLKSHNFLNYEALEIDRSLKTDHKDKTTYKSFIKHSTTHKYDVVIGNPPYIRWKNLETKLKDELIDNKIWQQYFNNLCDYSFIFILKAIMHLHDCGELIFICQDYFFTSTHALNLRNYMTEHGYFSDIFHFKESALFKGVNTSCVIFRYVNSKERNDFTNYYVYNNRKIPDILTLDLFDKIQIPNFEKDKRWILCSALRQKSTEHFAIECNSTIAEVCDIANGLVSGFDKAFIIDKESLNTLNEKEQNSVIKVAKAKDLQPFYYGSLSYYIFLDDDVDARSFKNDYPNFYKRLKPFEINLLKRYSYNRQIPYYLFIFKRNLNLFTQDKKRILVPSKDRISNKNKFRFSLVPSFVYATQDVSTLFLKDSCQESIEYVLAFLNNKRVFNYFLQHGVCKGNIIEFSKKQLGLIPYRGIDFKNPKEKQLHDRITLNVKNYLKDFNEKYLKDIENDFDEIFNKL